MSDEENVMRDRGVIRVEKVSGQSAERMKTHQQTQNCLCSTIECYVVTIVTIVAIA